MLPAGCGSATGASDVQAWEFTLDTAVATTAAVTCTAEGDCTGQSWTLSRPETDGCTLRVDFRARFSGQQVLLSSFTRSGDSNCSGPGTPRADSAGQGTADTAYPDAHVATGQVTLAFVGVLYAPGAPAPVTWQARRVS